MYLYKKNIILVPVDYDGISLRKGLLSLECFDNKTKCTLRCYSLDIEKKLILGIAINKKLTRVEFDTSKSLVIDFSLNDRVNNTDEISCVLLDIKENNYNIILWGSTELNKSWKSSLELMLEDNKFFNYGNKEKNIAVNQEVNAEEKLDNDETSGKKSDNIIEGLEKDESLNYTCDEQLEQYIDNVITLTEEEEQKDNSNSVPKELPSFFKRINDQINKMFDNNPSEEVLNEIIPNSKFCKVEFDDKTGYYVFGIVYDNDVPKYLCYGVPAKKENQPPKNLNEYYQWLPIDAEEENGDGFYMMYQDAETGKSMSVEII